MILYRFGIDCVCPDVTANSIIDSISTPSFQVFYKDGSVTNNNTVTFPDTSYVFGDNLAFMPTWLQKYAKDSEGKLHMRSVVVPMEHQRLAGRVENDGNNKLIC